MTSSKPKPRARKRSNGEGSIQTLPNGRYRWHYTWRSPEGKLVRRSGVCRTRREAADALASTSADKQRGELVAPSQMTVGDCLQMWLRDRKPRVSESTYYQYEIRLRLHVPPQLSRLPLQQLKAKHLREREAEMIERGLSASTRGKVLSHLRSALEMAVEHELLARNPALKVYAKPTTAELQNTRRKALTGAELQAFLAAAEPQHYAMLYTLFALGLRRGELLGLMWKDLNWEARSIQVVRQVRLVGDRLELAVLKTSNSKRTLHFGEDLEAQLRRQQQLQRERQRACPDAWQEHGLIFSSAVGTPVHPRNVNRTIANTCKRAKVRNFGSHAGRYTHITNRLRAGEKIEIVAAVAGHKSPSITIDLYREVLEDEKRTAVYDLGKELAKIG